MKLKKWVFVSGALIAMASCGDNSTTKETSNDSTASATMADPNTATPARSVDVPSSARTDFESKYPGASSITWGYYDEPYSSINWEWTAWPKLDEKDYVVRYNRDGIDYYTWYDQDGNWIGTSSKISDHSSLPAAVNKAVQKEFSGYTITAIDKENDKDREAYELKLANGDKKARALISGDGKILKKSGDVDEKKEKADVK
jgi:hypothetical protein